MAQRLGPDDLQAGMKQYRKGSRLFALGLLDRLARGPSIEALLPPPRYPPERALGTEVRRVPELQASKANVSDSQWRGRTTLVLADVGVSLCKSLKNTFNDLAERDRLVLLAIDALPSGRSGQQAGWNFNLGLAIQERQWEDSFRAQDTAPIHRRNSAPRIRAGQLFSCRR